MIFIIITSLRAFVPKKIMGGYRDSTIYSVLALHVAAPDLIPSTPYDIPSIPGVIPDQRVKSKP